MEQKMTIKYLRRPRSQDDNGYWRDPSQYHILAKDGKTSVCGHAVLDRNGFEIVSKENPVLRTMTCLNCQKGRG
jgi:hypothetical protein